MFRARETADSGENRLQLSCGEADWRPLTLCKFCRTPPGQVPPHVPFVHQLQAVGIECTQGTSRWVCDMVDNEHQTAGGVLVRTSQALLQDANLQSDVQVRHAITAVPLDAGLCCVVKYHGVLLQPILFLILQISSSPNI